MMVEVPSEYGYVILAVVASAFTMAYLGEMVASSRKRFKVDLPSLYADQSAAEKDKDKYLFNCYQRGHQNAIESYSQFIAMLLIGGLKHPLIAAACGIVWCAGRVMYAWGYQTGDPAKRSRGMIHLLGLLGVLGCSVSFALTLLRWI